jgi:hypothetical protein
MGCATNKVTHETDRCESYQRTLIHVAIVHTPADMGALSDSIRHRKVERLGRKGWQRNVNLVDRLWTQIESSIKELALAYPRVRIYQDGLPVCGREVEIVAELAKAGSRNHQLLLLLRKQGATIMGTESSELLVEEYQLVKEAFAPGARRRSPAGGSPQRALRDSLLMCRDQYIARRINETLLGGETGLLFLGMLHSVEPWLDKDIRVVQPALPAPSR